MLSAIDDLEDSPLFPLRADETLAQRSLGGGMLPGSRGVSRAPTFGELGA
eukprot:CAMPEP_0179493250 /NCGR_PEP_ID=MMETSP0799-20121207/67321_1 /TAXON_ID=46947 /ORGANISM="Geminigera cryophila, Strain CCMP2564" /LENGTH=49 /DNA_ID= /DNA_START= /DNA_END= /DNA_ORIENTATION=